MRVQLGIGGGLRPGLAALRQRDLPALRADAVAGLTVAAYLVPQVLAYAQVAGLAPVTGLWAATAALAAYAPPTRSSGRPASCRSALSRPRR